METRILGRTGRPVSVIGLGTWQLGADWGEVDPADARAVLETSLEQGITFYDTADVYGDGRSERFLGEFLAAHPDAGITVATKVVVISAATLLRPPVKRSTRRCTGQAT